MKISLKNVSKTFISHMPRKEVRAVQDISFEIGPGEIFGIIGPNGAGKSTIIKMLMGFIRPTCGQINLAGKSPCDPESRLNVGYLPENPYYYDHLSVTELMRFSAHTSGMSARETQEKITQMLEVMELTEAKDRRLRSYSKGMTQRAGFCFALVHDPGIVILDEPMSGLDPLGRKLIVDLILKLKREGKTILFCSHILNDIERLCDRLVVMNKGRAAAALAQDDFSSGASLEAMFMDIVGVGGEV